MLRGGEDAGRARCYHQRAVGWAVLLAALPAALQGVGQVALQGVGQGALPAAPQVAPLVVQRAAPLEVLQGVEQVVELVVQRVHQHLSR